MKKIFKKNLRQKGYAILFTVIIISVISVLAAGLANTAYKQLILSSLVKSSQEAFYQADTAGDCAFYADLVESQNGTFYEGTEGDPWPCGGLDLKVINSNYDPITGNGDYQLALHDQAVITPCFNIQVHKDSFSEPHTTIIAKGYNICNTSNSRTVEREIKITY